MKGSLADKNKGGVNITAGLSPCSISSPLFVLFLMCSYSHLFTLHCIVRISRILSNHVGYMLLMFWTNSGGIFNFM